MPTITEVRQQYPQYRDMSDGQLADALHSKFYSDMPREEFNAKIGFQETPVTIDSVVRSVARGVPVIGGAMDRIAAAADAATQPILGRGSGATSLSERYEANLAAERSKDAAFDERHPNVAGVAEFAGGAGAFGAAARFQRAAELLGISGDALLGMIARGTVSGGVIGGADSAVRGHDPITGAAFGAVFGGGTPAIGRAVGTAVESGTNAVRNFLGTSENTAAKKVGEAAARDALDLQSAREQLTQMGPDAMIADLGPNLQRQAGGVAATPGEAQQVVRTALRERDQATGQRLSGAVTEAMGDKKNLVELADDIVRRRKEVSNPLYRSAYEDGANGYWSDELAQLVQTPEMQTAIRAAQATAKNRAGADGMNVPLGAFVIENGKTSLRETNGGQYIPSLQLWDYVKRELDAIGTPTARRMSKILRDELDHQFPSYATARQAFASESAVKDALEDGQGIFANRLHPDAFRKMLGDMDNASREALIQGARGAVADAMATARTDASGAFNLLKKGFNREKLGILLGKQATDRLYATVQSELRKQGTNSIVTQNSETAARQASRADLQGLRPEISAQDAFALGGVTGVVRTQALQHATNFINGLRNGDRASVEKSIAEILTATGPERDAALQQVFTQAKAADPSGRLAAQITSIVAGGMRSIQSGLQPSLP